MVRKNISIDDLDYQIISDYAIKNGFSFSELLRKAALSFIEKDEEIALASFLNSHLNYVSDEEQAEIDALNINYTDLSGEELSLDDIL